jgi:hypothetical protein
MLRPRWFVYDFIPAGVEITRAERESIRRAVKGRDRNLWRSAGLRRSLVAMVLSLGVLLAIVMATLWTGRFGWSPTNHLPLIAFAAALFAGYVARLTIYAPIRARNTFDVLRQRGFEVCPECGYFLRGLDPSVQRCPECGREREDLPPPPEPEPKVVDPLRKDMPPQGFDQWS